MKDKIIAVFLVVYLILLGYIVIQLSELEGKLTNIQIVLDEPIEYDIIIIINE